MTTEELQEFVLVHWTSPKNQFEVLYTTQVTVIHAPSGVVSMYHMTEVWNGTIVKRAEGNG